MTKYFLFCGLTLIVSLFANPSFSGTGTCTATNGATIDGGKCCKALGATGCTCDESNASTSGKVSCSASTIKAGTKVNVSESTVKKGAMLESSGTETVNKAPEQKFQEQEQQSPVSTGKSRSASDKITLTCVPGSDDYNIDKCHKEIKSK